MSNEKELFDKALDQRKKANRNLFWAHSAILSLAEIIFINNKNNNNNNINLFYSQYKKFTDLPKDKKDTFIRMALDICGIIHNDYFIAMEEEL